MRIDKHPLLTFERSREITFFFNDRELKAYEGETIAVALHAAGVKILSYSHRRNRPRGFFCAIGHCAACLMKVNGTVNVRTCTTPVQAGDMVETQLGKGEISWTTRK